MSEEINEPAMLGHELASLVLASGQDHPRKHPMSGRSWQLETAEEAQRWHNQMHATRAGHCPEPPNGGPPDDLYLVHSCVFTGNTELRAELAATNGHVFVGAETGAWCVRCDHRARMWTLRWVFLPAGTPCKQAPDTAAAAVTSPSSQDQQ